MRALALLLLLTPAVVAADVEPPVLALEIHMGGSVTGPIYVPWRPPALNLGVGVETAVLTQPWTSVFGEVSIYTVNGTDVGVAGGVRVRPGSSALRISGGVAAIVVPKRALGPRIGVGACFGPRTARLCGDIQATAYLTGDALPVQTVAADVRIVIAIAFHLL